MVEQLNYLFEERRATNPRFISSHSIQRNSAGALGRPAFIPLHFISAPCPFVSFIPERDVAAINSFPWSGHSLICLLSLSFIPLIILFLSIPFIHSLPFACWWAAAITAQLFQQRWLPSTNQREGNFMNFIGLLSLSFLFIKSNNSTNFLVDVDWLMKKRREQPAFAKSIHQQSLHFSSFINHFFIYWPPINLKKWIDWREWRVDELNGAVLAASSSTKPNNSQFPFSKRIVKLFWLLLVLCGLITLISQCLISWIYLFVNSKKNSIIKHSSIPVINYCYNIIFNQSIQFINSFHWFN